MLCTRRLCRDKHSSVICAKMMTLLVAIFLLITVTGGTGKLPLQAVTDSDMLELIKDAGNAVVLFTRDDCEECDRLEKVIEDIHNDLKEHLDAVVAKVHNSQLVTVYDPTREPSLVYFRRGNPLLYYGHHTKDEIFRMFSNNQEPVVRELSDKDFEHLTQASTGATTGDWFIFFYSIDCVLGHRLNAVWESVGARLRHVLNVARVNSRENGEMTAKRFAVTKSPAFIFLRQGKLYRYRLSDYTPKSFIAFAEGGYRNQGQPEDVPLPVSSQTDIVPGVPMPTVVMVAAITLLIVIVLKYKLKGRKAVKGKNEGENETEGEDESEGESKNKKGR